MKAFAFYGLYYRNYNKLHTDVVGVAAAAVVDVAVAVEGAGAYASAVVEDDVNDVDADAGPDVGAVGVVVAVVASYDVCTLNCMWREHVLRQQHHLQHHLPHSYRKDLMLAML